MYSSKTIFVKVEGVEEAAKLQQFLADHCPDHVRFYDKGSITYSITQYPDYNYIGINESGICTYSQKEVDRFSKAKEVVELNELLTRPYTRRVYTVFGTSTACDDDKVQGVIAIRSFIQPADAQDWVSEEMDKGPLQHETYSFDAVFLALVFARVNPASHATP